jgi:hypothetical protein
VPSGAAAVPSEAAVSLGVAVPSGAVLSDNLPPVRRVPSPSLSPRKSTKVGKSISLSFIEVLHQQGVTWIVQIMSRNAIEIVCDETIFPVIAYEIVAIANYKPLRKDDEQRV